jgi:hypothetical protein
LRNWNDTKTTLVGNYESELVACNHKDVALLAVTGHQQQVFNVLVALLDVKVVVIAYDELEKYFRLNVFPESIFL